MQADVPVTTDAPPSPDAPDWSTTTERIACPLCDYDLRGLADPRCPECGYQFVWTDLTDPARRRHPFVFEHHPEANAWSFFKTLFAGLRPRSFWTSLLPSQPSKPKRLAIYAIIVSLFASLVPTGLIVLEGVALARDHQSSRRSNMWMFIANNSGLNPTSVTPAQREALLDRVYPLPPSRAFFSRLFQRRSDARGLIPVLVVSVAWPWFTFAGLMVFQISMLRAKVNNVHAFRCVVYCSDAAVWHALALGLMLGGFSYAGYRLKTDTPTVAAMAVTLAFGLFFTVRLWRACKHYLRFERPLATAVCAQAICLFTTLFVLVQLANFLEPW